MGRSLTLCTRVNNAFRAPLKLPALESLVARVTRDRPPTSLLARLAPNHYQYRSGSNRRVERFGLALELDISDFVDWNIFYALADGGHDALIQHVERDETILDVGANNGCLSLRLAREVGPGGRVISFELHPHNVARFRANQNLNALANVELVEMGLGDSRQSLAMIEPDPTNAGMNRMAPGGGP